MEAIPYYSIWMIIVFVIGYSLIILEHFIKIDKASIALMMGISCWVIEYTQSGNQCSLSLTCLGEHIFNISQIVFFLLGALGIVEIISAHKGFSMITDNLQITSKKKLLWTVSFISFFLSAVLDNLTTTVVMVSLLSKLIDESEDRWIIGGGVVIAANAGGAWTPIGDVTTTMLWIGGQISTVEVMRVLLVPSLICMLISIFVLSFMLKGHFSKKEIHPGKHIEPLGKVVFVLGIGALVFVPIFKLLTGLPPFMGMLFGLSALWIITDIVHKDYNHRQHLRVPGILSKLDFSGLLFFLGILLAVDALDSAKILEGLAHWFDTNLRNTELIAIVIGLASAVVDNVPLVAASMGMYPLQTYPVDSPFWQMIAYCAGTGGSILIIGSAAGVVFMGLEKADFIWYVRKISLAALLGYLGGIAVYLVF